MVLFMLILKHTDHSLYTLWVYMDIDICTYVCILYVHIALNIIHICTRVCVCVYICLHGGACLHSKTTPEPDQVRGAG